MNTKAIYILGLVSVAFAVNSAAAAVMPFTDAFTSGPLDASWSNFGTPGAFNGTGQYVITDAETGSGTSSGLERTIGVGNFQSQLDAININSTSTSQFVYYWQLRESTVSFSVPGIAVGLGLGSANSLTTFTFDANGNISQERQTALPSGVLPMNLNLAITWQSSSTGGGQWDVLYDTNGGTPTTEINGGPLEPVMNSDRAVGYCGDEQEAIPQ